ALLDRDGLGASLIEGRCDDRVQPGVALRVGAARIVDNVDGRHITRRDTREDLCRGGERELSHSGHRGYRWSAAGSTSNPRPGRSGAVATPSRTSSVLSMRRCSPSMPCSGSVISTCGTLASAAARCTWISGYTCGLTSMPYAAANAQIR